LLSRHGLVEYIIENQIDLVISLNPKSHISLKTLSNNINFASYEERVINDKLESTVLKKEISFVLEKSDVIHVFFSFQ
jgi:hypothetical protein